MFVAVSSFAFSGRMYLESLTFGKAKWPPVNGITSTTKVCFDPAVSMSMTPAARPQIAHMA